MGNIGKGTELFTLVTFFALVAGACDSGSTSLGTFDRDEVIRTCVLQVSCLGEDAPLRPVGACVDDFQFGIATGAGILFGPSGAQLEHIVSCGAAAGDCTSALECASYGHGPDYCRVNPGRTCDGGIRVVCDAASEWAFESEDCAALGLECREGMTAGGSLTAVCTDGVTCDPADSTNTCEGTRAVRCTSTGLRTSVDCAAFAIPATCATFTRDDGEVVEGCVPVGPPCTTTETRCDGTLVVGCASGVEARIDCAAINEGHCEMDGSGVRCVPDATECTESDPDLCEGDDLRSCINGRHASRSCTALGFAGCGEDASGAAICTL